MKNNMTRVISTRITEQEYQLLEKLRNQLDIEYDEFGETHTISIALRFLIRNTEIVSETFGFSNSKDEKEAKEKRSQEINARFKEKFGEEV